jgi:hypothetical protein
MRALIYLLVFGLISFSLPAAADGSSSYTAYGTATCAPGWTVAYTGAASAPYIGAGGGVGSPVCFAGAAPGNNGGIYWFYGAVSGTFFVPACAVCIK